MRKGHFLILIVVAILLAACGEDATPTPVPPTEAPPEPTPTEVIEQAAPTEAPPTEVAPTEAAPTEVPPTPASPLAEMAHVPDSQLIDILWEWQRRDSSPGGDTDFVVPNPSAYTITFNEDGSLKAIMDCNSAAGQYATSSPGSIFMELGASTMAECGSDSLLGQFCSHASRFSTFFRSQQKSRPR